MNFDRYLESVHIERGEYDAGTLSEKSNIINAYNAYLAAIAPPPQTQGNNNY